MPDYLIARAIALIALIAAFAGVLAACTTSISRNAGAADPRTAASTATASTPAPASGRCRPGMPMPMNMNSPDAQLGQQIGREAGTRLAGDAPLTVSDAQIRMLGNQVPAGATVETCLNRITFTGAADSLVIEAVPAANPDMTFRIAGLVSPTIVVPLNAQVRIEYINADSDEAHAFVITSASPPFTFHPAAWPAFPGAAAGPIGDPTPAGHGAEDLTFTASTAGVYHYLCPMPGHAEMGMYANLMVR